MFAKRPQSLLVLTAVSGFTSVALGAFAAHALKNRLDTYGTHIFETAHQYHSVHTIALLGTAILLILASRSRWLIVGANFFLYGIVLFSGSLYALALSGPKWLGIVTPIGGLFFLAGWLALGIASRNQRWSATAD